MNDNESNQNSDNQNSLVGSNANALENTRHYNMSQTLATNMSNISDPNKENNSLVSTSTDRGTETQPRSITSEYESIPSIGNVFS